MTCPACDNARKHPLSGRYQAGCTGCAARSLARTPLFFTSAKAGNLTPDYRRALAQFFPTTPVQEAHALVKEWV